MGVAVLSPQDCLQNSLTSVRHRRNPRAHRSQPTRKNRNNNHYNNSKNSNASPPRAADVGKNLVMGQVKILKRGEPLKPDPASANRLGPDPSQIQLTEPQRPPPSLNGFYAGSAFITSPPPSELPLPAFFMKKSVAVKKDDATTDLCRMLRINL